MKFKGLVLLLIFGAFGLTSCIKEPNSNGGDTLEYSNKRVGVLCEGNYMWNNARFDVYSIDSNQYYSNIFESVNKMPLGDVLQSGCTDTNYVWLSVNNSGKIVALNRKTLKQQKSRGGLKSPRYILPVKQYLFVSDLTANAVLMLDSATLQTVHEFKVMSGTSGSNRYGWTEQMALWNNEVVVSCYDGYLMFINPSTKNSYKFEADTGCQNLVVDKNNSLWVLSSVNGLASIVCYGSNQKELKRFAFPAGDGVSRLCLSPNGTDLLYIHKNKVMKLGVTANSLADASVVYSGFQTCYGLGIDPRNGWVYIADAKDYVSEGKVFILNENYELVKSYNSGIIPGGFVFF